MAPRAPPNKNRPYSSLHHRQDVVIQPVSYVGDPTGLDVGLDGNPLREEHERLFHPSARRGDDEGDRETKLVQGSLSLDRLVAHYSNPVARSCEPGKARESVRVEIPGLYGTGKRRLGRGQQFPHLAMILAPSDEGSNGGEEREGPQAGRFGKEGPCPVSSTSVSPTSKTTASMRWGSTTWGDFPDMVDPLGRIAWRAGYPRGISLSMARRSSRAAASGSGASTI